MSDLRVFVLEDQALTASAYEDYVARLPGVSVVKVAGTRREALLHLFGTLRALGDFGVDVMLVDMNLPDGHGLDVLGELRKAGYDGGAIALTAAGDRAVLRRALSLGVTHYLLKPFGFDEFAAQLRAWVSLHRALGRSGKAAAQQDVDAIFSPGAPGRAELPKGLTPETLERVRAALAQSPRAMSASEVGAAVGTSRVTARRYLEHLAETGLVSRSPRHGSPGRPEMEYTPAGT